MDSGGKGCFWACCCNLLLLWANSKNLFGLGGSRTGKESVLRIVHITAKISCWRAERASQMFLGNLPGTACWRCSQCWCFHPWHGMSCTGSSFPLLLGTSCRRLQHFLAALSWVSWLLIIYFPSSQDFWVYFLNANLSPSPPSHPV